MTTHIITDTTKLFSSALANFPKSILALYPEASETTGGITTLQAGGFKLSRNMEVQYIRSTFVILANGPGTPKVYNLKIQLKREDTSGVLVISDTLQFSHPASSDAVFMRFNFPMNGFLCDANVNYAVDAIVDQSTFGIVCNYPEAYRTMVGSIPRCNPKYEIIGYKI